MKCLPLFLFGFLLFSATSWSSPLQIGQTAPTVTLSGELGGRVSGEPWLSDEIAKIGKVVSVFYIDPEETKLNEPVEAAYELEHFPLEKHASIGIINMAAAWYPNSMINSKLKKKQEQFPVVTYVKDLKKTLVKEWGLEDDSVNVTVFGKDGRLLFLKKGKMNSQEISGLMKLIRNSL